MSLRMVSVCVCEGLGLGSKGGWDGEGVMSPSMDRKQQQLTKSAVVHYFASLSFSPLLPRSPLPCLAACMSGNYSGPSELCPTGNYDDVDDLLFASVGQGGLGWAGSRALR